MVPYKYELSYRYIYIYIVYISDSHVGGKPEGCITSQNRDGSFTNYSHFPTSSQLLSRFWDAFTHAGMTEKQGVYIFWWME